LTHKASGRLGKTADKVEESLIVEKNLSIIALVGDRMKNHSGISGKFFSALGRNGVNIRAIAQGSSERNITAVISNADVNKSTNTIHEVFFEKEIREVNLFIAGVGNVGAKLLDQILQQQEYLLHNMRLKVNVVGIANSKKFWADENGIDLSNWKQLLISGKTADIQEYIEMIREKNLRNAVFADVTANDDVASVYDKLLQKSIAVVACNKVACSSPYPYYKKLKELSTEYNTKFLFETNVGASLPIIGTINDLLRSGDNIHSMEAVLSGTLNFVFNNYDGSSSFASVVKQAQEEGYTEPDPRLDLSGKDVMRKIMILVREAGHVIEMEDIGNNSFMPEACMQGSVTDFYESMEAHEAHFKKIYDDAAASGCKLKFVASFKEGKANVGLLHIPPPHDFYHLYGKDNIVLFYTDRYTQQPLVIKGAGAGAAVTASGVFADIIRTSKA
jgi:aspartokinase/homoserine dehydrogenase 1